MKNPALAYRQLSVQGASPMGLVVMLYDGAIATLSEAIAAIEAHDIERKCRHYRRALAIIIQLEGTLNFELGGEVASDLQSFYTYARAQIMKANIQNSAEIGRSLLEHFTTLRNAWREGERRLTILESGTRNPELEFGA